jgi:alpha-tubulin suppressor-like RCC1 family protein
MHAQDVTITNADQLAAVIDQSVLWYPLVGPTEQSLSSQALGVFWADFSQLTNSIGDVRNFEGETQYGVTVWRLRLTRTANETVFSYPSTDTNLCQLAATTEDGFSNHYDRVLWSWCILAAGMNAEPYEDLLADGYTFLNPQRLVLDIWLGDVNDCDTYDANVATANSLALELATNEFMAMGEDDGGDPCSITNLTQPFFVTIITQSVNHATTITWQSCQFFRYLVWEANTLSTNTQWVPQAYVWGATNASSTTWTDTATTNDDGSTITQRFYRVQRLLGSPIAAGGESSIALRPDGTLWSWGSNDGELGDGLDSAIQMGSYYPEQYRPYPGEVADVTVCVGQTISNATALAAGGDDFTVVVNATGTVWTCGENTQGQLGNDTFNPASQDTPLPVAGVSNIVSVAAGFQHVLALRTDGTVWAWGNDSFADGNDAGQLGAGTPLYEIDSPTQSLVASDTMIVAIACGDYHSLALDVSGNVWGWGDNEFGQIGSGAATGSDSGTNRPIQVQGVSNVIAIAAGDEHTIALTADKRVWTWGSDSYGQLGWNANQSGTNPTPGLVTALTNKNVVAIAGGVGFTLAVTSNGQVYAWGDNTFGELGTNSSAVASTNSPMLVTGISNAVWVSAPRSDDSLGTLHSTNLNYSGGVHSLVVTVDQGTNHFWGWGDNSYGQVGNGVSGNAAAQISQYTPAGPLQFCTRCQRTVQLGTDGSFTAQCNGTLYLYFNTDNFDACTGQYNVTFGSLITNVLANSITGVAVALVTNGDTYSFSANGFCTYDANGDATDPNGNLTNGVHAGCSFMNLNITNAVCPTAMCFSLVGKIQ